MYMYGFNFMNCEDGSIHFSASNDRFILLTGDANRCAINDKICVVNHNHKRVNKIQLYSADVDVNFKALDVVIEICSEEAANSFSSINPRLMQCKLVVCGKYAHMLSDEFRKVCEELSVTGAEPNEVS